jgi:hypothetical protein
VFPRCWDIARDLTKDFYNAIIKNSKFPYEEFEMNRLLDRLEVFLTAAVFVIGIAAFSSGVYNIVAASTNDVDIFARLIIGTILAGGSGTRLFASIRESRRRRRARLKPQHLPNIQ